MPLRSQGEKVHTYRHCLAKKVVSFSLLAMLFLLGACSSAYYNTMEKFGVHKRDIVVERVTKARDAQTGAKEQFKTALEQFSEVVEVQGGDLEKKYNSLNREYEKSKAEAELVHERIQSVENVSEALFQEWQKELGEYSSATLRRDSEQKLKETRYQYEPLIAAMKRAEDKIDPVLSVFHDQVLYLKHNLNAQAIASLQGERIHLEKNVAQLVKEMEESIREADQFISHLNQN